MKHSWVIAVASTMLISAACAAKKEVRFSCEEQCRVSFMELVPNKSRYDSEVIYISGFLTLTNGILSLQPSKETYLSSVGDPNCIIFRIPAQEQKRIIDSYLNQYVSVRSRFRVGSEDPVVGMGYFFGDIDVYRAVTRMEPENIDAWRVRYDEL